MLEIQLSFPKEAFTREETTARTRDGVRKIVYRAYEHIPYVRKPVDMEYQSLDIWVPETVDGVQMETENAQSILSSG